MEQGKLRLALLAGARAINKNRDLHGTIYVLDPLGKPEEIPYLEAAQVLIEQAEHLKDIDPCPDDCRWRQIGRYHKCTSCARSRNRPDNYIPGVHPEKEDT